MGIRLVKFKRFGSSNGESDLYDHDALYNRDLKNQHPIYAITGLEKALLELRELIDTMVVDISPDEGNGIILKENGLFCESGSSSVLKIHQESHNLSIGNAVYLSSTGVYKKAICEDSEKIEVIGIVNKIIDEDNLTIIISGEFETDIFNQYSSGDILYLSNNTSGLVTNTIGHYVKPIGVKIESGILINIQRASIYSPDGGGIIYYDEKEIIDAVDEIWEIYLGDLGGDLDASDN